MPGPIIGGCDCTYECGCNCREGCGCGTKQTVELGTAIAEEDTVLRPRERGDDEEGLVNFSSATVDTL